MILATINVQHGPRNIVVRPVQPTIRVVQSIVRTTSGEATTLVSPYNSATKITFEADGGMTLQSPVRITLKNTTTGDEMNYA